MSRVQFCNCNDYVNYLNVTEIECVVTVLRDLYVISNTRGFVNGN